MIRSFKQYLVTGLRLCLAVLALAAVAPAGAQGAAPAAAVSGALSSYRVGPGDVLSIRVMGEDDLSVKGVRLTDAGTLFYPALGELNVRGMTIGELEALVTSRLKGRILLNPQVLVQVEEYRPFFITGMVKAPGSIAYQPGLNVNKAAALAGGFQERASMSKIFVVREGKREDQMEKVELDSPIYPGDFIIVRESFF